MKNNFAINVYSEIGKLKTVLLHRPGDELVNLAPDLLERLLFDDTPDILVAQKEHDYFAKVLKDNGVEVKYIEELVAETIDQDKEIKKQFIDKFIAESGVEKQYEKQLREYLESFNSLDMVKKMIAGVTKHELGISCQNDDYPLVIDPLPNILFQRDPFASIGNGATIHRMFTVTRNRETLFADTVLRHHKDFKDRINIWCGRNESNPIEGGDILVLNHDTLIIGVSQRTNMDAIRKVANNIINNDTISYNKVIAIDLKTKNRAFMHLDTVFTNIDYDKFIAHPLIFESMDQFRIIEITKDGEKDINKKLDTYLSEVIGKEVKFIKCGGEDPISQAREQWNDGTNVLTISPGKVIAYDRNHVTIDLLKKAGVEVLTIPSSELSRGRGGPRCMSMPLWREDI